MREEIVHYVCAVKAINYMPHCTYVTNLHIYEQPFIVQLLPCLHIANLGNVNKSKDNWRQLTEKTCLLGFRHKPRKDHFIVEGVGRGGQLQKQNKKS